MHENQNQELHTHKFASYFLIRSKYSNHFRIIFLNIHTLRNYYTLTILRICNMLGLLFNIPMSNRVTFSC